MYGSVNEVVCISPINKQQTKIAVKKTELKLSQLGNQNLDPKDFMETHALKTIQNTSNCLKYHGSIYYDNYVYVLMERMDADVEQLKRRVFSSPSEINLAKKRADQLASRQARSPVHKKLGSGLRELLATKMTEQIWTRVPPTCGILFGGLLKN